MDRDDIIRMAREAGMGTERHADGDYVWGGPSQTEVMMRFAALVAEREREECAKLCDEMEASAALSYLEKYRTRIIAAAIRARGETK